MDKTAIIVVTICALLFGGWLVEESKIAQDQARAKAIFDATNQVAQAATPFPTTNTGSTPVLTTPTPVMFDTNLAEQTIVLTNAHARYTFTSRGGGLERVDLLDYPEAISQRWKKTKVAGDATASLNTHAPVPVLTVLGDPSLVGNGQFSLARTGNTVQARKVLPGGLVVLKQFEISSNYLVNTSVRLENTTGKPLALPAQELVTGTATPMDVDDTSMTEGMMWFDGSTAQDQVVTWFGGGGFACYRSEPRSEYWAGSNNVVWVAAHNQYFTFLAIPKEPVAKVVGRSVTLPAFANVELNANTPLPKGVQTALVYPAQTLAANSAVEHQITLYAGPKEYRTLADIGIKYQNHADNVMSFGRYLGFFAKVLLLAMNWVHDITTLGYGAVIVLITVIIKAMFWPLTAASTRSMKRMQALGPELKALQEKYKDDAQKLPAKQWELYKKHKVNPMSGCLPMLIQMPVFIGFFTMIRSAIELRGAHFLWVTDLSKPDTLFMLHLGGLDLPFNLLPLLMGGAMLWQAHLTPPSPGMDPSQQKIMRYMPLMFLVFLYSYPAGLALYWTANNLLTILQTKLTKNLKDPAALTVLPPTSNPALTRMPKSKK